MADPNQTDAGENRDTTYEPSTAQVNRARQQGIGVGQKDIDYQRDPTGARSAEQFSFESDSELDSRHPREGTEAPGQGLASGGSHRSSDMANRQDDRQRQPQQGQQNRQPQQGQGQQNRQPQQGQSGQQNRQQTQDKGSRSQQDKGQTMMHNRNQGR